MSMGDAGLNPAIGTQKYISPLNTAVLYSSLPTAYSAYPTNSSYILGCNLRPNRKYSSIAFPDMNSYDCIYIFGLFLIISRTSFIRPFTMSISRAFLSHQSGLSKNTSTGNNWFEQAKLLLHLNLQIPSLLLWAIRPVLLLCVGAGS